MSDTVNIQTRRDTAGAWTANNPLLLVGELGFEVDTLKFKLGNGVSSWTALSYIPTGGGGGSGTVTSVAMSATGPLSVSGSPITTTGTLALTWSGAATNLVLADGTTTLLSSLATTASLASYLTIASAASTYQPLDSDLTAIAALSTNGFAKRTGAGTWAIDTATYLTANQTITLSGIITGSGTTAITTAIADAALSIAKTSGLQAALDAKMTTASYPDLVAIEALAGTTGLARKTAANTWSLDTATYLTANQTVTLSGIITGSGTTAITTAIADAALSIAKTSGLQTALDIKMMKISASSSAASVANTTTTTAILSTSLIAANQAPGTLMDITCEGTMRFATLSNTITFTLLLGSVTLGTFTIVGTDITGSAINTDYHYKLTGRLSPQTGPGASSNVGFYGVFTVMGTTASTVVDIAVIGTAINTTVSNNVIINVAWSAAATNNSITTNYTLVGKLA